MKFWYNNKSKERPIKTLIVLSIKRDKEKAKKIRWDLGNCCLSSINKMKVSSPINVKNVIKKLCPKVILGNLSKRFII
jgi:hypothetical protein